MSQSDRSWAEQIAELRARQAAALEMGGPEKVRIHRERGKLTVRERIDQLLDRGSFRELGSITGAASYREDGTMSSFVPANSLFGRGKIDGRVVAVCADDFTVRGGAADAAIHEKQIQAEQMAHELGLPMVRLIDGSGGGGSVKMLETNGYTYVPANPGWNWVVANLARVPVISLGLGSIAGLGAARLVSSHYSLLLRDVGHMFAAGPAIVAALGQNVSKDELGGAEVHARSGAIDDIAENEADAFEKARRFLSYLPSNTDELAPRAAPEDTPERCEPWLDEIVPRNRRQVYKMRQVLEGVLDRGSFFEIGKRWGRSAITGLARLDGWPVAIIASDPMIYGGAWTADSAQKLVRFIELAETFHLPVVHFVDIPGMLVGVEAEKAGTMRHGARALASVYQATVPWCTIIVRKAFGVAGAAMCNHTRYRYRYAWPSADWGSLPIEGGIEAAYKAQLAAAADPEALKEEITERLNRVRSPFLTAERFLIEEIIAPRETRPLLCEFANLAAPMRRPGRALFTFRP
ncbi:MAG TPA: carboxyl transferase domain-containing protein [Steroidobacter sp.]|uniref:acyl-CoA carboxylase subunit beta n=1 Tax=Steroidobacter sp. TaxID=1978227 RepID=UPI002ED9B609